MKIVECKHKELANNKNAGLGRVFGNFNLPVTRQTQKLEDFIIQALQKRLDRRFICLRNCFPADVSNSPALVLIAPQGVYLFRVSPLKGVFRAAGEAWEMLEARSKKFIPAKPNLLLETLQIAQQMDSQLALAGIQAPRSEPVVYFSDPGAHVDAEQPVVRLLLVDALDRYLSGILRLPSILEPEVIEAITNTLGASGIEQFKADASKNERDIFSLQELEEKKIKKVSPSLKPEFKEPKFFKKIQFSRRQWVLLSFLLIVNIVVLVALVVVVLVLT
jgi:hypothetical protein